jgi:GNAT superfamily N-acetyltransferase
VKAVIAEERYSTELARQMQPLLERHYREVARNQDLTPLDVNWAAYESGDAAGKLLILTARDEGKLIGYSVFYLVRSPHYKSTLWGMNDVLYVLPGYRQSGVGLKLMRESEHALRAKRCQKITWHVKEQNADGSPNPLQAILARRGYEVGELMMERLL